MTAATFKPSVMSAAALIFYDSSFYERRGLYTYCDGRRSVNIRQLILFMSAATLKTTVMGTAALILF